MSPLVFLPSFPLISALDPQLIVLLCQFSLRRNASSKRARPSKPRLVEDDLGLDDEEDEASQDPHDDADVTDCEDAPGPNGSNNGEAIEAAANIHD